jgi:hypothetical protein
MHGTVKSSPVHTIEHLVSLARVKKLPMPLALCKSQAGKWDDRCIKCIIGQQAVAGLQRPSDAEADPSSR